MPVPLVTRGGRPVFCRGNGAQRGKEGDGWDSDPWRDNKEYQICVHSEHC
jgi:hypothetical protein